MLSHKGYGILLSLLFLLPALVLPVTSLFLQPVYGDLTRIGRYREADFGWNHPQQAFTRSLYAMRDKTYDVDADVVVLGDSFSKNRRKAWPNYFVRSTGLSLDLYLHYHGAVDDVLDSPLFKVKPPRILVYETVERDLWRRLRSRPGGKCHAPQRLTFSATLAFRTPGESTQIFDRWRKLHGSVRTYRQSWDFLETNLYRLFGSDITQVESLRLRADAPFSSRETRRLLVYRHDLEKREWEPKTLRHIVCALTEMQRRVEANGVTAFVAMLVPDKLTAYADFLADRSLAGLSPLRRMAVAAEKTGLSLPRVDLALQDAIRSGVEDVYLPNDTHWGSAGHRLAADVLIEHLIQRGVIAQGSDRGSVAVATSAGGN